jgi:hypothetical protein
MGIVIACAATSAYAAPAKTTAGQCKIAGQPLALGEVHDALVATPNGRIVVLAGDGKLHAYRPRAGSACVLDVDRTFGKDGVIDSRIGSDFSAARLEVDSSGTLYASSGQKQMQVVGTKVTPMCGEGLVAASPRSAHVWRWFAINAVTRASGSCEGGVASGLPIQGDPTAPLRFTWGELRHRRGRDDPDARLCLSRSSSTGYGP